MEHGHESLFADPRTWVGIAFVIFFVIFGRKAWAAITSMLDKRGQDIQAELDEAARLRREAEQMLRAAQEQREATVREAQAMLEHARVEAASVAENARTEAAAAAERRERLAHDRIGAAEKAAISEVRLAAAEIATRAAEMVVAQGFKEDADAPLIDRAIQGLPTALSGRRAA